MDILFAIDGTGPSSDTEYKTAFAKSHVRTMWANWHTPMRGYLRGPTWDGLGTSNLADTGVKWVAEKYNTLKMLADAGGTYNIKAPRVFLTGFSRGGAAVTYMSHRLQEKGIDVQALLLFDAVDRSTMGDTDIIPANVKMTYHARRDPLAGSREMFGNCALKAKVKGTYEETFFYCTHGGVGGTPWSKNGKSGKIEEMTTEEKTGATILGGYMGYRWANKNDFTNVTVKQDRLGSVASGKWMNKKLTVAMASNRTAAIGNLGPYNLNGPGTRTG